jgi:hypothetical protein
MDYLKEGHNVGYRKRSAGLPVVDAAPPVGMVDHEPPRFLAGWKIWRMNTIVRSSDCFLAGRPCPGGAFPRNDLLIASLGGRLCVDEFEFVVGFYYERRRGGEGKMKVIDKQQCSGRNIFCKNR